MSARQPGPGPHVLGARAIALVALSALAATIVGCGSGGMGGGKTALEVDGEAGGWHVQTDPDPALSDAQFNPWGVKTAVMLRARDGERQVEAYVAFMGPPSEPTYLEQKVSYRDADGTVYERVSRRTPDEDEDGIRWERVDLDADKGTGYASVVLDLPVCVDHYTGPLEYETRCHQLTGTISSSLVRARLLRLSP